MSLQKNKSKVNFARMFRQITAFVLCCSLYSVGFSHFLSNPAYAFEPLNNGFFFGIGGAVNPTDRTHESITRIGVTDLVIDEFFPGKSLSQSMKNAINEIIKENANTDKPVTGFASDPRFHFDNEEFDRGQLLLISQLQGIKLALQNKNAKEARKRLGQALHTIQDFYSHSNWVEMVKSEAPNPNLGRIGMPIVNQAGMGSTCIDCLPSPDCLVCIDNIETDLLTSGYFDIISTPFTKPSGKCSHGGSLDGTSAFPAKGGINKDSTSCNKSPHHFLHKTAASAAINATKQFVRDLKEGPIKLTESELKLLFGVGNTLAFAIDTTGSMGSVIAGIRQQAIQIVNDRLGTDKEPSKYVLVGFGDPSFGPVLETTDPDEFKAALGNLTASGGGDCPELSMKGTEMALSKTDEGGDLFVATDASAKDNALYSEVNALAISNKIKINHLIFGTCSPIDPAYINLSNNSGGQLFFLQRSEANNITKLTDFLVQPNAVDILSIGENLSGAKTYTIPVDSTLSKVTFSVSGTTSVQVKRPDGSVVQASNPGVTFVGLTSGAIYSIDDPADGEWTINVNGSGIFSLKATGESTLSISSLNFVEEGGRPGHGGFFPIAGFPKLGSKTIINALLSENVGTAQFELRTKTGAVLQTLDLERGQENTALEFFGEVMLPNTDFLIYVKGMDMIGNAFQRVIATTYKPQSVKIEAPEAKELPAGVVTSYTFKVTNLGSSEAFNFTASDDKGFVKSVSPSNFTLGTDETKDVTVELMPPANTPVDTSDTLTVSVQGLTSGSNNFAVITSSTATGNLPPNVSQASPSRNVLFPANNSMILVGITNVTDPEGNPVTIKIDRIMQDEVAEEVANPVVLSLDPCPDAALLGGSSAFLRAQRSLFGNGRVYTIFFTATDGNGGSSQGSVKVSVPRNSTSGAIDDGPSFSSMTCRP